MTNSCIAVTDLARLLFFLVTLALFDPKLPAADTHIAISHHGQIHSAPFESVRDGFAQPDMIYAPFTFWFWDEPLEPAEYPEKARTMAREMLKQRINPGYAHARVSMPDLVGPKLMAPSPSLPKEQWMSPDWFQAFDAALQEAEAAQAYFGYVDEYMWPVGRAAGRVFQRHPELANASLQWEVTDMSGGTQVELPQSFFTVAAQLDQEPKSSALSVPIATSTFELADKLSYLTEPELMQGEWIWQLENVSTPHTCYFRKAFDLAAGQQVVRAQVKITADNRYKLFVNGVLVGQGEDWSRPGTHHVTQALRSGRNVMAVEGGGDGGLDAMLCDLRIDLANGEGIRIASDGSWLSSETATEGWSATEYNDAQWKKVRVFGPAAMAPWNLSQAKMPYRHATIRSTTLQLIGSGDKFNWTAPSEGHWRIYSFKKSMGGDVNVLDERLPSAFIEIAHKPYADRFGDRMGRSIPGVFCDTEGNYGNGNGLAWSDSLAPRYLANTGRDLRLWMPLMLDDDVEGFSARARFDWFEAVSDLYAGFYAQVSDWLAARGMYYTGHVWEETLQRQVSCVSDHMKVQRAFSMPGMDALGLSSYDVHDFKEVQSVAAFEGRRYLSEFLGAGDWPTFTPETIKDCMNANIAWGVGHISHHGVFMTRTVKVWVPDWYDENPMWSKLHLWSDFTRRAVYVNSQGRVEPDVLLVNPMESVWALLGQTDKLWWSPEAGHVGFMDQLYSPQAQEVNAIYSEAMRQLTGHRVEYLIADRHYISQMSVDGAQLVRGEFRFKTLVLPSMVVMPLNVARKTVEFAKAGGLVYTLGELPTGSTDNGLSDPVMAALMAELRALPNVSACTHGLAQTLDANAAGLTSPIQFVSGEFPMLQLRRRIDDRDFFWLANNSEQPRQCVVQVADVAGAASVWDCETGTIRPVASTNDGTGSRIPLAFQPHEGYWLVFDPKQPARSKPIMALPNEEVVLQVVGTWTVQLDLTVQPNLEHAIDIPAPWRAPEGIEHDLTLWETWAEVPPKFSGLLDYSKTVTLPECEGDLVLDLGEVNHFAEVWVNGTYVGAKLWPPHRFETTAFRPGTNEIRIRVGNLVNNNYDMASPSGLMGPVMLKRSPGSEGMGSASAQQSVKVEQKELRIPRVSKPWKEALRLVGDGTTLYSDFALIKDKLDRWHCIGTFGKGRDGTGNGYALSDGYALFHAVGNSLEAPMTHLDKIPYQIASPQAYMWAPAVIWNRDRSTAFLFYFHYLGSSEFKENCTRLLTSDAPDLTAWRLYDSADLAEQNLVFREQDDRDFCVFWDDRLNMYLMYYACAGIYPGLPGLNTIVRVRTSKDLLHWSEPTTVMGPPPGGYQCAESPFVLYRDGYYYLWVSGIDYSRVSLYISENPFNFGDPAANRIEEQPGHAPEIVSDKGEDYMACSMVSTVPSASPAAHDLEGILIQSLRWDKPDSGMEERVTRQPK